MARRATSSPPRARRASAASGGARPQHARRSDAPAIPRFLESPVVVLTMETIRCSRDGRSRGRAATCSRRGRGRAGRRRARAAPVVPVSRPRRPPRGVEVGRVRGSSPRWCRRPRRHGRRVPGDRSDARPPGGVEADRRTLRATMSSGRGSSASAGSPHRSSIRTSCRSTTRQEGARLYVTMRFVDGTDLRALLAEEGRLGPARRRGSSRRSPARSTRRTGTASSTATSSPATSSSAPATEASARISRTSASRSSAPPAPS